jgi:group I intron endonuclease
MWKNLINDKQYIGSAIDLSNRLSFYYSTTYMENALTRSNSHIYRALLKNGYSNFSLTILEYCSPEQCIEREDYYLCSLPHEYNILPKAGSRLGHNHSDETKTKISDAMTGKTLSDETKTKISDTMKGQKKNSRVGKPSQQIEVTDITNETTTSYNSIREAARVLNIHKSVIDNYFKNNQQKPYKGRYNFTKGPQN